MYEQMFRDISQQYTIVLQSAVTLLGSFAIAALAEKNLIPIDIAVSIISLICVWFILNIVECSYWYNRNLCIIANIERQFLSDSDINDIQYYFGSHRPNNVMTSHLKNQCFLGWSLLSIVLFYQFFEKIFPEFFNHRFDILDLLPYIVTAFAIGYLYHRANLRNKAYKEFIENSPGKVINTNGVKFGIGHGHKS